VIFAPVVEVTTPVCPFTETVPVMDAPVRESVAVTVTHEELVKLAV